MKVWNTRPLQTRSQSNAGTTAHLLMPNESVYSRSPKKRKENTIKAGDVYTCDACGAEFTATRACDCEGCQPRCCDKPLRLKDEGPAAPQGGCCCS
jgi:hypothetical protein